MANMKIIKISTSSAAATCTVRDTIQQGDVDAYRLEIRLTDIQSITGRAELRFIFPDGQYADRSADSVVGNVITYDMDSTDYSQTGDLICLVRLLDNNLYTPVLLIFKNIRSLVGNIEYTGQIVPYPEWAGEVIQRLDAGTAIAIGPPGPGLEFEWDGYRLGVRIEGDDNYAYSDSLRGKRGEGLDFDWDGTSLSVKGEDDAEFDDYVDLKGKQGDTWKPTVDASGKLTWAKDATGTVPTARDLKGDTGKGVKSTEIKYAVSASGTTIPTTWDSAVQLPDHGDFLWSRIVITYTDDTASTVYVTGYHGEKGDKGEIGPALNVRGELQNQNALPPSNNTSGDAYVIAGHLWVWTGSAWIDIGDLQGPEGESGFTWRPSVSAAGVLTWTKSSSEITPTQQNIKGPPGDPGTPGSDANVTAQSIAAALTYTPANAATLTGHMTNYEDPHEYLDEADTGDYAGVRYIFTMIDGEPFMKVVAV